MALRDLVLALLVAVLSIFAGATILLIAHGVWLGLYRRWSTPRLAQAHAAVNAVLLGEDPRTSRDTLARLPLSLRTRVLVELSRKISGESRARLTRLAIDTGVLQHARRRLRSRLWGRRLLAARTLQSLDAEGSPFLQLLDDSHPAVRAQAAEWAAEEPEPRTAAALLGLFDRQDTLSRFTAQDSLVRLGTFAIEPVARFLTTRAGRDAIPALHVAVALAQPAFGEAAIHHCGSFLPEVRRLAADLLGTIGGREGAETLVRLLDDPDFAVRAAAARALGRIGHWPAAVAVAERLRDPEWEVRQAAGFALRSLGSPGALMLRRYRSDADPFAADMARQILDIPEGVEAPA